MTIDEEFKNIEGMIEDVLSLGEGVLTYILDSCIEWNEDTKKYELSPDFLPIVFWDARLYLIIKTVHTLTAEQLMQLKEIANSYKLTFEIQPATEQLMKDDDYPFSFKGIDNDIEKVCYLFYNPNNDDVS